MFCRAEASGGHANQIYRTRRGDSVVVNYGSTSRGYGTACFSGRGMAERAVGESFPDRAEDDSDDENS
jgi:hypothetical protein